MNKGMTKEVLEDLEKKINEHFFREAQLVTEMLDSDLTVLEHEELNVFLRNHPWAKAGREIKKITRARGPKKA